MIRINQLKLPVGHSEEELKEKLGKELRIFTSQIKKYEIWKKSVDARRAPVHYVYTVDVWTENEAKVLKKLRGGNAGAAKRTVYRFPEHGTRPLQHRPVIVGSGPAGLFCGLMLAREGYRPILLERGKTAAQRKKAVDLFWEKGILDPDSNVQFGEGGAGTFSDGKLNTLVKDPAGRNRKVLEVFVEAGAPEEILYWNKPHLGTDILIPVVEHIRREIIALGGEVRFDSRVSKLRVKDGRVTGVWVERTGGKESEGYELDTQVLILAIGHSARDTFRMLADRQVPMEEKAFAVGVRIEHPQELIDGNQYGRNYPKELPAATYKLTRKVSADRGVYSFCMCPGGYVVNASSEPDGIAVNGMSYQARDSRNANSAMIVTVRPGDFKAPGVLAGMEFQRKLEQEAWRLGGGKVPVQLLGDFYKNRVSSGLGGIEPCIKGAWTFANVREIFPENLAAALAEGIGGCEALIRGFGRADAVLSGVESRTSSPVRILRGEDMESELKGLYPCGEGAGYAGGITSAAMDGIKTAEAVAKRYGSLS